MDANSKLAEVRTAMLDDDWERVIRLVARLRNLGKHQAEIDRANDFLNNPRFYEQLGYSKEEVISEAIAAIKKKYSRSWKEVKDAKDS